jgi:signal recognition particle receptor subunit beta
LIDNNRENAQLAAFSEISREIMIKIAYVGVPGAGKTTNIQSIFRQTSPDLRSRPFDLTQLQNANPYFDFLPLSIAEYRSQSIKLNLFSIPAHRQWKTLRMQLLHGIDGIVWVVDSRNDRIDENERVLFQLENDLAELGVALSSIPCITQFNHRDSNDAAPLHALQSAFGIKASSHQEAVAARDIGVLETIEKLGEKIIGMMDEVPTEYPMQIRILGANNRPSGIHHEQAE